MGDSSSELLTDLLKQVSRSFYLTMRVLPPAIRPQIGIAYLLARTSDTIADTQIIEPAERLRALDTLREQILGRSREPFNLGALARQQSSHAEWSLLERVEESLALFRQFPSADRHRIRESLAVIISGQELDLRRFAGASREHIVSLNNDEELDDYTYRVAGCVGELWTHLCRAHLFPKAALDEDRLMADGVRFGKGLQLLNILRDLPRDLRQGRCYLPGDRLWAIGLAPIDLLEPASGVKLRPLYDHYLAEAEAHLAAGWGYVNALPRSQAWLRLACAWPLLIGLETLEKLRAVNVLAPELHVKITRSQVRGIVMRTFLYYPWSKAWAGLFNPRRDSANKVDLKPPFG